MRPVRPRGRSGSRRSWPESSRGLDHEEPAGPDADAGHRDEPDVRQAPGTAEMERLIAKGVAEALGRDTLGRVAQWQERDEVPDAARQVAGPGQPTVIGADQEREPGAMLVVEDGGPASRAGCCRERDVARGVIDSSPPRAPMTTIVPAPA